MKKFKFTASETGNDVATDEEKPVMEAPNLSGSESGIIKRVGFNGTCMYNTSIYSLKKVINKTLDPF